MTLGDARRIVQSVSRERGTTPEFPDPLRKELSIWPGPGGLPSDLSRQEMVRLIEVNEAAKTRPHRDTRSHLWWKRLLGRG
jgi:hypothetical protein